MVSFPYVRLLLSTLSGSHRAGASANHFITYHDGKLGSYLGQDSDEASLCGLLLSAGVGPAVAFFSAGRIYRC